MAEPIDRYPGIRRFELYQERIFKGRENETVELFNLVKRERTVVVFAKSGIGKSSLINAGLLPRLIKNNFRSIEVRFQYNKEEKVTIKEKFTAPLLNQDSTTNNLPTNYPKEHKGKLWEIWKSYYIQFAKDFPNQTPFFILDQFEEFFLYNKDERFAFWTELTEILNDQVPSRVLDWVSNNMKGESGDEILSFVEQPPIKIVLAIRSDRLFEMNEITKFYPILRQRYELLPLSRENAQEGIIFPAKAESTEDTQFTTHPYTYHKDALKIILDNLEAIDNDKTNQTDELNQDGIDTSQLQMVCSELEKKIQKSQANNVIINEITSDFFGGKDGLEKLKADFYENQVEDASQKQSINKETIKQIIEDFFLVDKYRVSLSIKQLMAYIEENDAISLPIDRIQPLLDALIQLRIFRKQDGSTGKVYEIGHDSLINPILKSRQERTDRETQAEELRKKIEDEKLKEKEREEELKLAKIKYQAKEIEFLRINAALQKSEQKGKYIRNISILVILFASAFFYIINKSNTNYKNLLSRNIYYQAQKLYNEGNHVKAFKLYKYLNDSLKMKLTNQRFALIGQGRTTLTSDEKYFFVQSHDLSLVRWLPNNGNGKVQAMDTLQNVVNSEATKDGNKVMYLDSTGNLKIFDRNKKEERTLLTKKNNKSFVGENILTFNISNDGETYFYIYQDYIYITKKNKTKKIRLANLFGIKNFALLEGNYNPPVFDKHSGNLLTWIDSNNDVKLIDLEKETNMKISINDRFDKLVNFSNQKLFYSEEHDDFFSGLSDNLIIKIFDLKDGFKLENTIKMSKSSDKIEFSKSTIPKDKDSSFLLVAKTKLLFYQKNRLKLLDLTKPDTLFDVPSQIKTIGGYIFISPDNKKFMYSNGDTQYAIYFNNQTYDIPELTLSWVKLYDNYFNLTKNKIYRYDYLRFMKNDLNDDEINAKIDYLDKLYPELTPTEKQSFEIEDDKSLIQKIFGFLN